MKIAFLNNIDPDLPEESVLRLFDFDHKEAS